MSWSVLDLITEALEDIGVNAAGEPPDPGNVDSCFRSLKLMLESWGARGLVVRSNTWEEFSLVAGTKSYTIGTGGVFNTTKPSKILSAVLKDDTSDVWLPVDVVTLQEYNNYDDRDISDTQVRAIAYDPGSAQQATQMGTVYCYPIPDDSSPYKLRLEMVKPFTAFVTVNDTVTFDAPYAPAIAAELAVMVWRKFHRSEPLPMDLLRKSSNFMSVLENINSSIPVAPIFISGGKSSGAYSITTGPYGQG